MTPGNKNSADRVVFRASPTKTVQLLLGCLVFVAGGLFMIVDPTGQFGLMGDIIGFASVAFSGLGMFVIGRELLRRGEVIVVDQEGILDKRLSPGVIPWSAIGNVSQSTVAGERFVMLAIDPDFDSTADITTKARWTRSANEGFAKTRSAKDRQAFVGYSITMRGLEGSHDKLVAAIQRFAPNPDTHSNS